MNLQPRCLSLGRLRGSASALRARFFVRAVALATLSSFVTGVACAAAPVEESRAAGSSAYNRPDAGVERAGVERAGAETGRLTDLYYQLQVLQGEVQTLRGIVEEQQHQIRRLTQDQKEQYIDLDSRVASLTRGGMSTAPAGSNNPGGAGAQGQSADPSSGHGGRPNNLGGGQGATDDGAGMAAGPEKTAYTAAFNLMKARQFDASIDEFNRFVLDFPNGGYTPNAFYWLGELHLAKNQDEFARQSFAQVINLYPDHNKIPDALYKLGVVYHRLGDRHRSLEYLNRVRAEHPGSSAAKLAQTYAQEML